MGSDETEAIEYLEQRLEKRLYSRELAIRLEVLLAIAKRNVEADSEPEYKSLQGTQVGTATVKIESAEVWPKWYVLDETQGSCESPWYIKRTSETEWLRFGKCYDGTIGFEEQREWPKLKPVSWLEVTEAEAMARVTPQNKTRTVTFRKWLVWDEPGKEKIMMLRDCDRVQNWLHCHDTGETETHEVPL